MSDKIRLLVTDGASGRFLARVRANAAAAPFDIIAPEDAGEDALLALAPEAEAVLTYKAALPASVIRRASRLRYIQKHGLNCKNIDLDCGARARHPRRHAVAHAQRHGGRAGADPHALLRAQDDSRPEGGRGGRLPRDGSRAGRHQPVGDPAQLAGDSGRRRAVRQERRGHRPGRHRHGHRPALRGLRHGYLLPPAHAPYARRGGAIPGRVSRVRRACSRASITSCWCCRTPKRARG